MSVRRLAAIDIGTVTTRLLVADLETTPVRGGASAPIVKVTEIERSTDITHLGEGLGDSGVLKPAAMVRVRAVLSRCRQRIDALGVEAWAAVATSASRDAANATDFLDLLDASGVRPEIIDGAREAALTFRGAVLGTRAVDVLVDDIGGGSTELVLGSVAEDQPGGVRIEHARSVDVGSRRLTDLLIDSDPPSDVSIMAVRTHAARAFGSFFSALERPVRDVISVAGTATSLVSVGLEMAVYDPLVVHGYRLTLDEIRKTRAYLAGMTLERRLGIVGLHPGRAPVIVAGALILEAVLEGAGVDSTLVSEHDILYGILLDVADSSACGNVQVGTRSR